MPMVDLDQHQLVAGTPTETACLHHTGLFDNVVAPSTAVELRAHGWVLQVDRHL